MTGRNDNPLTPHLGALSFRSTCNTEHHGTE
jgi:hypothetical protein